MLFLKFLYLLNFVIHIEGTIHTLTLKNDGRKNFPLSTFGFFTGGKLAVDFKNFSHHSNLNVDENTLQFGFSLQKTKNDGVSSYIMEKTAACLLEERSSFITNDMQIILLSFNLKDNRIDVERHGRSDFTNIQIEEGITAKRTYWMNKEFLQSHSNLGPNSHDKSYCHDVKSKPADKIDFKRFGKDSYSTAFTFSIDCSGHEGSYNLYFHNCANFHVESSVTVSFSLDLVEHNEKTFLSAGEIPLPAMYGLMSFAFFTIACVWIWFLRKYRSWTYKIHWLMATLVYMKSLSLAFHAVNYYYTGREGLHVQTWAILYYMIHLLTGVLLFPTIVLIGTGYYFVVQVLTKKEKVLVIIVILLQIIVNVGQIILESTEEGDALYKTWSQITIGIDLLCCGTILLPVVWTMKYLKKATTTGDGGNSTISLVKWKLFRYFYLMIVGYIYFTRIVAYLVTITVPFQYMWLAEFITEAATFFFFLLTGYKFRPVNINTYVFLSSY